MLLGTAKDGHFSFFQRSCQLGLIKSGYYIVPNPSTTLFEGIHLELEPTSMKLISMKMNGRITFGDWKITKDFWISNSNGTRNIYFTVTNVWDQSFMKKEECVALILSTKIDLDKHLLPQCPKFHFNFSIIRKDHHL